MYKDFISSSQGNKYKNKNSNHENVPQYTPSPSKEGAFAQPEKKCAVRSLRKWPVWNSTLLSTGAIPPWALSGLPPPCHLGPASFLPSAHAHTCWLCSGVSLHPRSLNFWWPGVPGVLHAYVTSRAEPPNTPSLTLPCPACLLWRPEDYAVIIPEPRDAKCVQPSLKCYFTSKTDFADEQGCFWSKCAGVIILSCRLKVMTGERQPPWGWGTEDRADFFRSKHSGNSIPLLHLHELNAPNSQLDPGSTFYL